ncbi:hypothetical protein INT45_009985 [Circinella minor]|uniref:K Homology domain-containing protein n=1 Tax=Circinella minor TaxID=1195481 RepID=A0A8H7VHZ4_9FUNG|nr:hypothetical protein INT45_009985 [Circinella minor]
MSNQQPGNYSAMPPPPSLTGEASPVNFNDALSKARAIAEKLKSQNAGTIPTPPAAGMKRNYRDDSYEEGYDSQSNFRGGNNNSGGDYYDDQRESKRGMFNRYESSSRPRYGLGSEERKSSTGYGSYGTNNSGIPSETFAQDECLVPNHMVGLVIGKGGDSLKKIERMSGAKVQIGPDMQEPERKVQLSGEEDQVKIARDMIQQIVDDGRANEATKHGRSNDGSTGPMGSYGPRSNNEKEGTTMMVPASKVGLIIGRGGENIRSLEERSGAKIFIVTTDTNSNDRTGERCVSISGEPAAMERAKAIIDEIVNDEPHSSGTVTPSRDWSAYRQQLQSHGGERGHRENDSYGAGGYGGRGNNNDDPYGTPSQDRGGYGGRGRYNNDGRYNNEGRYNNNDRFNNQEEEGEKESVLVPQNAVGFIIGRRGDTVRALQEQSGARIKVDPTGDPNAPERAISVFGNPEAVALAKKLIQDKVTEGNQVNRERGGGRYGNDGPSRGRGGYRGGYNNYHNNRYQHQQQHQYRNNNYVDSTAGGVAAAGGAPDNNGAPGGYDYSQYQQYYAPYGGYDQYQQGNNQGSNTGETQNQEGYQYGNYAYNYDGYGQPQQATTSEETKNNDSKDDKASTTKEGQDQQGEEQEGGGNKNDQVTSDYYSQYYDGQQQQQEGGSEQPQQQWTQEAYYQWYQQYYGQYPPTTTTTTTTSSENQEQPQDQSEQTEQTEQKNEQSDSNNDNNA